MDMNNQRDPATRDEVRKRGDWMDKASASIFVIFAAFIFIAAIALFFTAGDVEINPGKTTLDNTNTQTTPAPQRPSPQ
jgi:hypothetical protein